MATTKTKGAKAPAAPPTEDISHQVVKSELKTEGNGIQAHGDPVELEINTQIQKFDIAESGIQALKEKYGHLTVNGLEDKRGYLEVREAWSLVRSKRTAVEKKKEQIKADYLRIGRAIDAEEKRLVNLIKPLEDDLYAKWKAIDEEKERLKREAEMAEERRVLERVEQLLASGMHLTDGFYQIGESISIDVATLRTLDAEKYEKFLGMVQKKNEELKAAFAAEELRKKKEAEELLAQQAELKRQQDELARAQREMEEQKAAMKKQRDDLRHMQIRELGMHSEGDSYIFDNGFMPIFWDRSQISEMNDEQFRHALEVKRKQVAEAKEEAYKHQQEKDREAEELQRKTEFIHTAMEGKGLQYRPANGVYFFENPAGHVIHRMADMLTMTDQQITTLAKTAQESVKNFVDAERIRQEKEAKAAEAERQANQGDAVNYAEYVDLLLAVEVPKMTTKKYKGKTQQLRTFLEQIKATINE